MYKVDNVKDSTLGFRCDRVSCLGNPFIMQLESDRSRVINSHNNFLNTALLSPNMYDSLELNKKYKKVTRYYYLKELGLALQHPSKTFLCWCYPKACHCDNYVKFTESTRIVISGSRSITNTNVVYEKLDKILSNFNKTHTIKYLIGGESSRGIDSLLSNYARNRNWCYVPIKAEWNTYGKSAGYKRNTVMLNLASHFIAIWDGSSKGTEHAIKEASKLSLNSRVVIV